MEPVLLAPRTDSGHSHTLRSAAEADINPWRTVGLLTNPVAYEVAQPGPRLEVDILFFQHDPHLDGRFIRRVETHLDLP